MIAWVNGSIGVAASYWIATDKLGMEPAQAGLCIGASVVAGMIALLTTLQGERTPWIRQHVMNRSLKTWAIFVSLYFGLMLAFAPPLRSGHNLAWLVGPLILATGFTIVAFGPLQDALVRRRRPRV